MDPTQILILVFTVIAAVRHAGGFIRYAAAGRRCRRCGQPIRRVGEEVEAVRDYVAVCRTYRCVFCLKVTRERLAYGPACGLPL
jgi:uncharacterized protein with PIN domain